MFRIRIHFIERIQVAKEISQNHGKFPQILTKIIKIPPTIWIRSGSGSVSVISRNVSEDPDPYQIATDPKHC